MRGLTGRDGITSIELLVAMTLGLVVTLAALLLCSSGNRLVARLTTSQRALQELLAAAELWRTEWRGAGHDPTGTSGAGISLATPESLEFSGDWNGDGALAPTDANPNERLLFASGLFFGAAIAVAALAPSLALFVVFIALVGAGQIAFMSTCNTMAQLRAEPHMRGRVMAVYVMAVLGSTPIGGPLVGWISEEFGPRYGLALGNIRTHAAGGINIRIGWRLPEDFGADLIRPAGGDESPAKHTSVYFFASGEARAVARNIFLDGNTWRDSHSVDKRPIVADLSLGLVFQWPSFHFAYTQDYRTKEFYGQPRRDVFGSIGFSFSR